MLPLLLSCVLLLAAVSVRVAASDRVRTVDDVQLQPLQKWVHCIQDGRLNIRWAVHSSQGKLHSGVALPKQAEACKPSKPSSCKWLASCDASTQCSKFFPGELSGREKCVVVFNAGSESRQASIQVDLEPAGSWPAIIFGVVITSLGLLAVIAAGCYSDLKKLGDKRRKRAAKAAAAPGSNRVTQQ